MRFRFAPIAAAMLMAFSARADPALSSYEAETMHDAVDSVGGKIEPEPEGKIVESVEVVTLEVIEKRDPAPRFLNVFHATTRSATVRRESLVHVGDRYRQYRVEETLRDLRSFQQLSLVLATPMRGSTPDRVRLLIITKDTWSLRSQLQFGFGSGGLDVLLIEPTERNIAGTWNSALTRLVLLPESLTLGGAAYIPRFARLPLYFVSEANVVFNRRTGDAEGTYGGVALFTPFVSVDQSRVWQLGSNFSDVIVRRYINAKLATFDAPSTPEVETIPDAFRARQFTESGSFVWSYGHDHKLDLQLGAEVNVRQYVGLDPTQYAPAVVHDYDAARVPTSDDRAGPFFQARVYENRFLHLHDFDLLGLVEDYRVGYDVWARAYPVTRALGSTRDFVGVDAFAQYIVPLRSGYLRAAAESLWEVQSSGLPTEYFAGAVQLVSPSFGFGRLIVDGLAIDRAHNYLNERSGLGGDGRLRGYESGQFLGENLVTFNTELRTRGVEVLACQLGAAAFFDVGDAYDGKFDGLAPKSSVGVGLRGLFPQLDRQVWRFDVAFPVVRANGAGPVGFYFAFQQAFPSGVVIGPAAAPATALLNVAGTGLGQ